MVWSKRDDRAWQNEHLIALSHEAYRLYDVALSFCASEWPEGGGCLSRTRAEGLARMHCIADPAAAIEELRSSGRWERRARGMFHVHDIQKYMPPPKLSAARSDAGARGANARWGNKTRMANAMANTWQTDGSGNPDPVPEPESIPVSPNGDISPVLSLVENSRSIATSNGAGTKHRPPRGGEETPEPQDDSARPRADAAVIRRVFDHWQATTEHPMARLIPSRERAVRARLREGYSEDDLKAAIDGVRNDPWKERMVDGHDDLVYICRNGATVEKFRDLASRPAARTGSAWEGL